MKHSLATVLAGLSLVFRVLYLVFPLILVLSIVGFMGSCVASCGTIAYSGKGTSRSKGMDDESQEQSRKYDFFMYMCFMTALISGSITWLGVMLMDEIDNKK
jgi:hypothetical protein